MGQPVERPPRPRAAVAERFPHPLDLPHLDRRRAPRVRHDAIFGIGVGELDRLAALRKQIDDRRAAERQRIGVDRRAPAPAGRGRDRQRSRGGCRSDSSVFPSMRVKSTNRNFSGNAKYSVSSRNPAKLRAGHGSSASSGAKPDRLDRVRRQHHRRRVGRAVGIGDRQRVRAQQLVERQRDIGGAAQKKAQPIDAELGESRLAPSAHLRVMRSTLTAPRGERVGRRRQRQSGQPHILDLDRPQASAARRCGTGRFRPAPVRFRPRARHRAAPAASDPAASETA